MKAQRYYEKVKLHEDIEILRGKLHQLVREHSFTDKRVIALSQKINHLVNQYFYLKNVD